MTFIHRNGDNIHRQTDRAVLLDALQDKERHQQCKLQTARQQHRGGILYGQRVPTDSLLVRAPARIALLALVDDFQPLAPAKIFSGDRVSLKEPVYSSMALCIRALLPLAPLHCKVLDMSMFSLFCAYMGGLRGDSKLAALAQSSYASALGESSLYVEQIMTATKGAARTRSASSLHLLLLITVALQAFEVSQSASTD